MLLIKVGKTIFVFIYCTEQLNLKNISYWHYFTTKIMSICTIWNFTLYVTQSLHFFENHPCSKHIWVLVLLATLVGCQGHRHLFHSKNICPLLFINRRGHIFFEWNKCLWSGQVTFEIEVNLLCLFLLSFTLHYIKTA